MTESTIPLMKGDKVDINVDYRDYLPVNMYSVQKEILGSTGYMLCYPGLTEFSSDANLGIDRGAVYNDRFGSHFRVSGTNLIEVDADGNVTVLGTISGTDQVSMPYSFNTQCVIGDGKMWLYESVGGLVQVTDVDLLDPIDGIWINGLYFMTDGEYTFHTEPNVETSILPLDNDTSEFSPDRVIGLGKTRDNKVIVFGRYFIEYYTYTGAEDFSFAVIESRAQKIGLIATHAKVDVNGKYYFLGSRRESSPGIYTVDSGQYAKISTREIDKLICDCDESDFENSRFEARMLHNDVFIIMHLPDITLYYNATIGDAFGPDKAWGEIRSGYAYSYSAGMYRDVRSTDLTYRGINGIYDPRNAKWIYGDRKEGILGYLDATKFVQYGNKQEWILNTPFMQLETMSIDEISIETLPGFNSDYDANVAISKTNDGLIFGGEWWQLYGRKYDYGQRFMIRQIGYVNDWIGFRIRGVTDTRMSFSNMKITYS